jgi:sarcosine oxidase subunit delta
MLILECPNCGRRNASEFRFGGEYNPRPRNPMEASEEEWVEYLYLRDNTMGIQKEWWYHNSGCGLWFLAERHTRTSEVVKTYQWQANTPSGDA